MGSLLDEEFFRGQDIIDLQIGLENSGSEDAYLALLKLMYESSDVYINELDAFYAAMDLKNYTVKVHALKSSTRIIGAVGAGEKAQFLEYAAKAGDVDYIKANHEAFANEFRQIKTLLSGLFAKKETGAKPEADEELMSMTFSEIADAAGEMDYERMMGIFSEMEEYAIPQKYAELFKELQSAADEFDFDMVEQLLGKAGLMQEK